VMLLQGTKAKAQGFLESSVCQEVITQERIKGRLEMVQPYRMMREAGEGKRPGPRWYYSVTGRKRHLCSCGEYQKKRRNGHSALSEGGGGRRINRIDRAQKRKGGVDRWGMPSRDRVS